MSVNFYIVRGDTCPRCNGSGQIKNKYWRMWQEFSSRDATLFYQKHGKSPSDLEKRVPCPDCAGTGEIQSETTLAEALAELGIGQSEIR